MSFMCDVMRLDVLLECKLHYAQWCTIGIFSKYTKNVNIVVSNHCVPWDVLGVYIFMFNRLRFSRILLLWSPLLVAGKCVKRWKAG